MGRCGMCEALQTPNISLNTHHIHSDFLTQAGLMLVVGQLISIIPIKPVFLLSIVLFEIGSVLCGAVCPIMAHFLGRSDSM